MDPFNEVEEDCWTQIRALEAFIASAPAGNDAQLDFNNNYQELTETLQDLRQAVQISESNPAHFSLSSLDIAQRKQILAQLQEKIVSLETAWNQRDRTGQKDPHRRREVTTMSNRISQDSENQRIDEEFNQYQQQETIDAQDLQLDSIHQTMQNLNQQAALMGSELEDQGFMLDDLDHEMDSVGAKLSRGMKQVNHVIEANRETASNCCIGVLVVVLCVLLVVLIVA